MKVSPSQMADAISKELSKYCESTAVGLKDISAEVADTCVKELRSTSPKLTGAYKKGWKKKKSFENGTSVRYTVHNATDYQLTHLLEKGHVKRGGSRVAPVPHIAQAEQNAIEQMEKRVKEACNT